MEKSLRKEIDDLANVISLMVHIPYEGANLAQSLKSVGVEVNYFTDEDYDAFLTWNYDSNRPTISINATQPIDRQNFSLAHELGHLIINYKWIPLRDKPGTEPKTKILATEYRGGSYTKKQQKVETIVNEFAAAFLIPNRLLKLYVNSNSASNYQYMIPKLKELFGVSDEVVSIRVSNYIKINEAR